MADPKELMLTLPERVGEEDLYEILGRANFMCITIAKALRKGGVVIKTRAEHEQAATLLFLLRHFAADPINWRTNANSQIVRMMRDGEPPL